MREFKGSPLPWRIANVQNGKALIEDANGKCVADWVNIHDAELIVAQQNLLSALQAIVNELSDSDEEGLIEHVEPMIQARAAIAKALGQ